MMFDLNEIKEAQAKVKSGVDFPTYIKDIKKLGVKKYITFVKDGHTEYYGENDFQIKSKGAYSKLTVANISDKERFKHFLKSHQRGQTDFTTFRNNSAQTGVEKWIVDIDMMTCTYYDKSNEIMLEETIRI